MDISNIIWRFVNIVNTKNETEVYKSHSYHTLYNLLHKNSTVFIHTSYLPHLPYEANTYISFPNLEQAFEVLFDQYKKHAHFTTEGKLFMQAYYIMKGEIVNMADLCSFMNKTTITNTR